MLFRGFPIFGAGARPPQQPGEASGSEIAEAGRVQPGKASDDLAECAFPEGAGGGGVSGNRRQAGAERRMLAAVEARRVA